MGEERGAQLAELLRQGKFARLRRLPERFRDWQRLEVFAERVPVPGQAFIERTGALGNARREQRDKEHGKREDADKRRGDGQRTPQFWTAEPGKQLFKAARGHIQYVRGGGRRQKARVPRENDQRRDHESRGRIFADFDIKPPGKTDLCKPLA